jgi:hypothetical protein
MALPQRRTTHRSLDQVERHDYKQMSAYVIAEYLTLLPSDDNHRWLLRHCIGSCSGPRRANSRQPQHPFESRITAWAMAKLFVGAHTTTLALLQSHSTRPSCRADLKI